MSHDATTTLYRPVGPGELAKIQESKWTAFPPRLAWQPIFYPVLTEEYAIRIAREWNATDPKSDYRGYVTRFRVRTEFLARFEVKKVGGTGILEYWIPAEKLAEFNANIVGPIEVIHEFHGAENNQDRDDANPR